MAGGCGDDDLVWPAVEAAIYELDVPAGHFADQVASGAGAASVAVAGGSTVGVASDVVDVSDGGVTEGIPTGLVPQLDQLGEPAVEVAACRIAAHNRRRAFGRSFGCGEEPAPPFAALLLVMISRASWLGSGP